MTTIDAGYSYLTVSTLREGITQGSGAVCVRMAPAMLAQIENLGIVIQRSAVNTMTGSGLLRNSTVRCLGDVRIKLDAHIPRHTIVWEGPRGVPLLNIINIRLYP